MMATANFLCEPFDEHVAHTPLSSSFVVEPSLHDAASFLTETVAPAALNMSSCGRQDPSLGSPAISSYNLWSGFSQTFAQSCEKHPRTMRQWQAYLRCISMDDRDAVKKVLSSVNWWKLGGCTVVEANASSADLCISLAEQHHSLRFVIQRDSTSGQLANALKTSTPTQWLSTPRSSSSLEDLPLETSSRITFQERALGSPQMVTSAEVYLIRLPAPSPFLSLQAVSVMTTTELVCHLAVLRANARARVLLTSRVITDSSARDAETDTTEGLRELSLLQLVNDKEFNISELVDIVRAVRDSTGGLLVSDVVQIPQSPVVALEIKYEADYMHGARSVSALQGDRSIQKPLG